MVTTKAEKQIRLQIPIHKDVAAELERYAAGFERPVSWMARELIVNGVEREEDFMAWLTFRSLGKVLGNKREKIQSKQLPDCTDGDVVRIQVNVSDSLLRSIEKQARGNLRTVSYTHLTLPTILLV